MKKFLTILLSLIVIQQITIARDYTKLQKNEIKHAQKYGSTNRYFENYNINKYINNKSVYVKDPQIINLGNNYTVIDETRYNSKINSDEEEYKTYENQFKKVTWMNYNSQAQGRDYYRVYRIAERLIRANRLDYQAWRIVITRNSTEFNAYNTESNCIVLYTSVIDSLIENDDALAMVIAHELAHSLLGHQQRSIPDYSRLERMERLAKTGNLPAYIHSSVLSRKILIDSKNMEYAADIEGAKLVAKAGYDLDKCSKVLSFMETIGHDRRDFHSDHPDTRKRLESFNQNRVYFPIEIWKNVGKYNIYTTNVLKVTASSDRASIVISPSEGDINPSVYYRPETMSELYTRFGYTAYLNGEFEKSLENFNKLFETGSQNASAYLYASYSAEELYKKTNDEKYHKKAIYYINQAKQFDNNNKYINEQAESL